MLQKLCKKGMTSKQLLSIMHKNHIDLHRNVFIQIKLITQNKVQLTYSYEPLLRKGFGLPCYEKSFLTDWTAFIFVYHLETGCRRSGQQSVH